ncbi:MAG: acetyl/propionyl/methylcrotonyl-CoA carboxylase subunit alpha [Geminicoccaceae bacterium]
MFDAVLIANRGEIACRIIRTLKRLGIRAIAVCSDADRDARHVALAEEAIRIGPPPAGESYLRAEAILEAAARTGAQAIHPGYGFLAENAGFARACRDAGLTFIGPSPEAIEIMGAKDRAKAVAAAADVPLVPGHHGEPQDQASLLAAARELGFPVLLKAVAGGGGKGMRVVERSDDFAAALEGARREAAAAFGDDRMLLERYLLAPRHIEVQVFGDRHGQVVHLFERDCSVQRRHQKVIEEAPAPGLSAEQRRALGAAAVRLAQAIGYTNAGTIEFLMDRDDAFYFMEMNTRLQVEHPVTEMITGLDLVEWQLRVAAGERLPLAQEQIALSGHAIEARLYAEDPERGFLPSTGTLAHLRLPEPGEAVRIEPGVAVDDRITPFYDPMLAKVIAWGPDRRAARGRLRAALSETEIVGPATNLDFLGRVLDHQAFAAGPVATTFVEENASELLAPAPSADDRVLAIACLWLLCRRRQEAASAAAASADPFSRWHRVDGWRLNDVGHQTLRLRAAGEPVEIDAQADGAGWRLRIGGHELLGTATFTADDRLEVELEGVLSHASIVALGDQLHVFTPRGRCRVQRIDPLAIAASEDAAGDVLSAPMPGKIVRQLVAAGDRVKRGAALLVLEAMKMEHTIVAPSDGRVLAVRYAEHEQVEEGAVLLDFEEAVPDVGPMPHAVAR